MKDKKLFLIGGASGTGKTAICNHIAGKVDKLIVLDGDVIWSGGNFTPDKTEGFYSFCLRLCSSIADSGVSVAVFHAGMGIPSNIMNCQEKDLFSEICFLGLTCSDDELEKRLKARPEWQNTDASGFINAMKGMNAMYRFFPDTDGVHMDKLDTTDISLDESANKVIEWIKAAI